MKKAISLLLVTILLCSVFVSCAKEEKNMNNSMELTEEQSQEILDTIDWLPLGTIVSVDDSGQKLMIIGRMQQDKNNTDAKYAYGAVLYPQGLLNPKENYMFNLSKVKRIYYLGFSNDENKVFEEQLNQLMAENNISYD